MNRISIWIVFVFFFLLLRTTKSDEEEVRNSLINLYTILSNNSRPPDIALGWNVSGDPCKWSRITCDNRTLSVKKINFDGLNFTGTLDPNALCNVQSLSTSLTTVSVNNNSLRGENLEEIGNCRQLTHLYIGGNQFSGSLPDSLSTLHNLKVLDISRNNFSGNLPDLTRISGLQELFAQINQLTGPIPSFDFGNFGQFNISFNNFTGSIPFGGRRFPARSFIGNPELSGDPLPNPCPSSPLDPNSDQEKESKGRPKDLSVVQVLMFSGYFLIGLALFLFIILRLCKRAKTKEARVDAVEKNVASIDYSFHNPSIESGDFKAGLSQSGISATSAESGMASQSLVILTSPEVNGLKFDDLLKAPAELIGRGKHGTVYKVTGEKGMTLAVKRIRNWAISSNNFKERMRRLDQVKHPNVLPAIAFYCSKQEKLLVYKYQENGSLFSLLHGTQKGAFDWSSRLGVAATIAKALAFMHQELLEDGIAHGNLKSSNILLNKDMEPCITEYGLMTVDNEDQSLNSSFISQVGSSASAFKVDIYGLGVILLELLTAKVVQNNGMDLARWVLSVVREEWTVEVFDKSLLQEGASEERMVNLLQIAVKCVDGSLQARPSIDKVAHMISTIKEEEERSIISEL